MAIKLYFINSYLLKLFVLHVYSNGNKIKTQLWMESSVDNDFASLHPIFMGQRGV